jgi:hypothetical protein
MPRLPPRRHLNDRAAKRPNVRGEVVDGGVLANHLRRHPKRRPNRRARLCRRDHFNKSVSGDQVREGSKGGGVTVARSRSLRASQRPCRAGRWHLHHLNLGKGGWGGTFDVAMRDVALVEVLQAAHKLRRVHPQQRLRQRAEFRQQRREGPPRRVRHDDADGGVVALVVKVAHDVGVVKVDKHRKLALKRRHGLNDRRVGRVLVAEANFFQRDEITRRFVEGEVHARVRTGAAWEGGEGGDESARRQGRSGGGSMSMPR